MRESLISNECLRELRDALEFVGENSEIGDETLRSWMDSKCPEVQALACGYLFNEDEWNRTSADKMRVEFLSRFLKQSIIDDLGNVYRVNRYDALLYCQSWVLRDNAIDHLGGVRLVAELLAEVCRAGDDELRQAVVDVVLEHVFNDDKVRRCFAFWKSTDDLRPLYSEAIDLVQKWHDLDRKT